MRVVVTLTTIPTREDSVIRTIKSIQAGTFKPDVIYVNLPEWYPRFECAPDPNLKTKLGTFPQFCFKIRKPLRICEEF